MSGRALRGAAAAAAGALLLSGCYGGKTFEAVQRIELRQASMDSLQNVQRSELTQLRKDYEDQSKFLRSKGADTDTRLSEMAHRLDAVVSRLEDNNERFAQVLQKLDTTRPTSVVPADTSVRDTSAQGSRPMTTDPKPLYDAASADFTSGRYEQARTGFQSYVTQFATTELAGNAQYWIGETYYQQKQYPEALSAYRKVLDQYPHNIKVPAALLKQGMTQVLLGQKSDARDSFKKLVRDYPGTEQDAEARRQLKKMR